MGILLTILKVIGIILAVVLGLLLLIILAVLFVGISYRLEGAYSEEISVKARVAWLWRLIYVRFSYDKELDFVVRIFGIPLITKKRLDKKKAKKALAAEKNEDNISDEDVENAMSDNISTQQLTSKELPPGSQTDASADDGAWKTAAEVDSRPKQPETESQEEKEKKNVAADIKEKADATRNKVGSLIDKVRATKNKITSIAADEHNKAYFKKVLHLLKKVLKKLLIPKKHYIYVHYGSDDPGSTGQIAGYVAMAQAAVPLNLCFVPEFEEEVMEVKGYIYGKIRLISLVIPALKIVLDRRLRRLLKQIKSK